MLQWTQGDTHMFRSLLSVLLGICQEVELLGHMLILFLMFQGITVLFSIVAAPFYLPTGRAQKSQFLHILLTLSFVLFCFFPITIPMGMQWCLIVVFIWISLMISDVEHPFMCLLANGISSLEKYLFEPFVHFLLFFLYLMCRYFLPFCKLPFHSVDFFPLMYSFKFWCCRVYLSFFFFFSFVACALVSFPRNHWQI